MADRVDVERTGVGDSRCSPTTAGACISQRRAGAARAGAVEPPAWLPAARSTPTRSCCSCSTGSAGSSSQDRRHLAPTLSSMAGGPITSVAPSTTATALTSIATGLHPGRARRRRLPGRGRRRGAQRPALDHAGRRRPRAASTPTSSSRTPPFCGHRPPIVTRAEFAQLGVHAAPTSPTSASHGYRMPSTLVAEVRAAAAAPASRSSTPTTTASTRSPTSTASASTTTPSCAAADRLVADLLDVAAAGRRAGGHRRPRPGRRRRQHRDAATPTSLAHVSFQSGEGRFRWLHARPGPRRRAARGRRRPTTATPPGSAPATRPSTRAGWARRSPTRPRPASATSPSWPATPSSFDDPADTGPFELIGRHGSLTAAEMLVPLLVGTAEEPDACPTPRAIRRRPTTEPERRPRRAGRAPSGDVAGDGEAERAPRGGRGAGQGHAHRLDDQAAARGGAQRRARRAGPRPAAGDLRDARSTELGAAAVARPARRARPAGAPVRRRRDADRRRAARRPGPAGRLARGPVPRHPGHAVRPADGRPPAARGDARPDRPRWLPPGMAPAVPEDPDGPPDPAARYL